VIDRDFKKEESSWSSIFGGNKTTLSMYLEEYATGAE
jgi:hypothetical protein